MPGFFAPSRPHAENLPYRWTNVLNGVLPPAQPASTETVETTESRLRRDAARFTSALRDNAWRRTAADARQTVTSLAALPRGPLPTASLPGVRGGLAATATLIGASLACGLRLGIAALATVLALPVALVVASVRALGFGAPPPAAPPVLDWQLGDRAQLEAFRARLGAALQLKVPAASAGPAPAFDKTQLGLDLKRDPALVSIHDGNAWGSLPAAQTPPMREVASLQAVEARLRALTNDDAAWQTQLTAIASQSIGNSLLEAFFDGVGWRRVGNQILAPGERVENAGAAIFFQRRDNFDIQLPGGPRYDAGTRRDHVPVRASMRWLSKTSASAWRTICEAEGRPLPTATHFAPAGLELNFSLHLLRPSPESPTRLRLRRGRLQVTSLAG